MGIVISSIENKILQNYAKQADFDNSGDLNTKEEAETFISFVQAKEEKCHREYETGKKSSRNASFKFIGGFTAFGAILAPIMQVIVAKDMGVKIKDAIKNAGILKTMKSVGINTLAVAGICATASSLLLGGLSLLSGEQQEETNYKESKSLRIEAEELVKDLIMA